MGRAKVAYVEGRCVGGGSEINRGLYHRTPPEVLETWRREFRVQACSPSELRPHFEACEQTARVSYLPGEAPAISLKLQEGATNLGMELHRGAAAVQLRERRVLGLARQEAVDERDLRAALSGGRRQALAILAWCAWRATAAAGACAPSMPRTACAGVPWRSGAATVVVACGAVQTPALLRRSGITRNVGNALAFHPMVKLVARFAERGQSAE